MSKTATKTKREIPKRQPRPLPPTKASQEKFAAEFKIRNVQRKVCRETDPVAYRAGRRNRRELASNGCFGHADVEIFNQCVVGTYGIPKVAKDRED